MKGATVLLITVVWLGAACRGSSSPAGDGDGGGVAVDAGGDGAAPAPPPTGEPCDPVHTITVDGDALHDPIVGIDGNGDAIMLWRQGEYSGNHAMGSVRGGRFDRDDGWGTATPFEHGGGGYPGYSLAVDASGAAVAVWQDDHTSDDHRIWTSHYLPGDGWTPVAELPTDVAPSVFGAPAVAVDGRGGAIAVWNAADGLRATRYGERGWESSSVLLDEGVNSGATVAIGPGGVAMAVWAHYTETRPALMARRFAPGAGWGEPAPVDDNAGPASLAFDGAGDAIVTWSRYVETGYENWAARYVGTSWGTPRRLDLSATRSDPPRLAVAASGHAVAVWTEFVETQPNSEMPRVAAATFDPASGWSDSMLLQTENPAFGQDVGMDGEGNALVAWHEFESTPDGSLDTHVVARRVAPAAGWGDKFLLIEAPAAHPRLTMNAAGDAVIAWTSAAENSTVALHACAYP